MTHVPLDPVALADMLRRESIEPAPIVVAQAAPVQVAPAVVTAAPAAKKGTKP